MKIYTKGSLIRELKKIRKQGLSPKKFIECLEKGLILIDFDARTRNMTIFSIRSEILTVLKNHPLNKQKEKLSLGL